ncbi:11-beta-hydroxysteroid dehydrogenase B-like isoform X2 [Nicotiana tomentosiformis]|uniref:11-beta-hydroxysteroid dehydrogenase B-like isoform X2 n=1 Tax=Nicotiana tomentosiformis TaxID=4098 RepID=UPI000878C03B|nr:11-beta-hydroxysteroid dehydrogenase-like 5 isoform X2 [Nicotiana tomentosiformis]
MDLVNSVLNFVVPPASLVMLACAWPAFTFINICERLYNTFFGEDMEDKVVIITGASSGIGEQIAYEYAKRRTNLVLVARRENRLWGIREKARQLGAKNVLIMAADVVKEDDCRRFITETVNFYGRVDHLVNTVSLGHTFYLEEATDTNVFPILMAAKAAVINFYETLKLEVKDDVGITIATHGWIGTEITRGKFMMDEGADMQWKEEREVGASGSSVEEFAKLIVAGACRGDPYVKYPGWYDIFLLYRVFAPNILQWTFRMLFAHQGARKTSFIGTGRPLLETSPSSSPQRLGAPIVMQDLQKME